MNFQHPEYLLAAMAIFGFLGSRTQKRGQYFSIGAQEQTRFRSPKALSIRAAAGQNFLSRTQGAG